MTPDSDLTGHRLVSYRRSPPALSVSALVDVMLILVVFVMLAARFDPTRDLAVDLPPAARARPPASATGQAPDPDAVTLAVPVRGPMLLDGAPVEPGQLAVRLADSKTRRARAGGADGAPGAPGTDDALRVVADGALPLARVTEILAIAADAGFSSVSIATRPERPGRRGDDHAL